MSIRKYLSSGSLHELSRYSRVADYSKGNVAFTGTPKMHPYDKEKIILISDPFSSHIFFYEFRVKDIAHVDELPQIVAESGESLAMVRIWVKKGSFGVRSEPFVTDDTLNCMKDGIFPSKRKGK
ncbi:MAG: inorganic pyrophosphatase Ppa [Spirochaetaceae bacterium]|nr:MAG: inorganic pyrophosphatase Ppa [Spirochaetaceae bacterium]